MVEVYRDEYLALLIEQNGPLVRLNRSTARFPSREALEACYERALAALAKAGGALGRVYLADMRMAPGRNDPWFEEAMRHIRPRLFSGFSRLAVLVSTSVGALQLERISKEDGLTRLVTTDEAEAIEYLKGNTAGKPSKRGGPLSRS